MKGTGIWIEGERQLYANMQKSLFSITEAGRKGLRQAGMNIIADAKDNLRGNHSVVTGQLRAMGKVQKVEDDPDAIDAGFFAQGSSQGYAYFVEYGRRATKTSEKGNPTLFQAIKQWLRKKGAVAKGSALRSAAVFQGRSVDKMLDSLAAMITKSIHKKGTKPHPFFAPAVEKNKADIERAIGNEIKEVL